MARADYVYVLYWLDYEVKGTFTVKREMERYVKGTDNPVEWWAKRFRDGDPEYMPVELAFDKNGKASENIPAAEHKRLAEPEGLTPLEEWEQDILGEEPDPDAR